MQSTSPQRQLSSNLELPSPTLQVGNWEQEPDDLPIQYCFKGEHILSAPHAQAVSFLLAMVPFVCSHLPYEHVSAALLQRAPGSSHSTVSPHKHGIGFVLAPSENGHNGSLVHKLELAWQLFVVVVLIEVKDGVRRKKRVENIY